jgi:hypothetical protein
LELHDKLSTALSKAEPVLPHSGGCKINSTPVSTILPPNVVTVAPTSQKVDSLSIPNVPILNLSGLDSSSIPSPTNNSSRITRVNTFDYSTDNISCLNSIVRMLRRGGDRLETMRAVSQLVRLCNCEGEQQAAVLNAMREAKALQILLSALTRSSDWPDIEVQISKVISVLVAYEDDWQLLNRGAFDILSSLWQLQLKTSARVRSSSAEIEVSSSPKEINSTSNLIKLDEIKEKESVKDVRELVAAALAKLTLVLCAEWSQNPEILQGNSNNVNTKTNTTVGKTRPTSWSSKSDPTRLLETVLNIVLTVCDGSAYYSGSSRTPKNTPRSRSPSESTSPPNPSFINPIPIVDNASILCSIAICNLSEIPECRAGLVSGGVLRLLKNWIEWGSEMIAEIKSQSNPEHLDNKLPLELINNSTSAIMYIVGGSDCRYENPSHSTVQLRSNGSYDYMVGWIDAQVIAEGVISSLVTLIFSTVETVLIDIKADARDNKPHFSTQTDMNISQTLLLLSSRPQNRPQMHQIGVPLSLCHILLSAINDWNVLCSYEQDQINKIKSNADDTILEKPTEFSRFSRRPSLKKNKKNGLTPNSSPSSHYSNYIQDVSDSTCIMSSLSSCLDGLSNFLYDDVASNPCIQVPPISTESTFSLIDAMCTFPIINVIKKVSLLHRCPARLSCLRLIYFLSTIPVALNALFNGDLTDSLVLICFEAQEEHLSRNHSNNSSFNKTKSINSVSNPSHTENNTDKSDFIEESMNVCFSLANFSAAGPLFASRLCNAGLLPIMLPLIKSSHFEISRQTVRCVAEMCNIISSKEHVSTLNQKQKTSQIYASLSALSEALRSPSLLVQREAVYGIANLAYSGEQIIDAIVTGPLKEIVGIINDYNSSDQETRIAAQKVLHNIGFQGGLSDVEMCSYDVQLLIDWYELKMSLHPQSLARQCIQSWISELFVNDLYKNNEKDSPLSFGTSVTQLNSDNSLNIVDSGTPLSIDKNNLDSNSFPSISANASNSIEHLLTVVRSNSETTLSTLSGQPLTNHRNYHHHSLTLKPKGINLSFPQLQRHLSDSLIRFLPVCLNSASAMKILKEEEDDDDDNNNKFDNKKIVLSIDQNDRDFDQPFSAHMINRHSAGSIGGRSSPGSVSGSDIFDTPITNGSTPVTSSSFLSKSFTDGDIHPWGGDVDIDNDQPTPNVINLLDLYYPSKLYQLHLLGLASLFTENEVQSQKLQHKLGLPQSYEMNGIFVHNRPYAFSLLIRVIEKMINDEDQNNIHSHDKDNSEVKWSLTFQDGDNVDENFHNSLLKTLRKYPQIASLSFTSLIENIEEDTKMGHLGGNVPQSVQYLNFRACISRESVQALCIILKRENASFNRISPIILEQMTSSNSNSLQIPPTATPTDEIDDINLPMNYPTKGILGLGITQVLLEQTEIDEIMQLLSTSNYTSTNTLKTNSCNLPSNCDNKIGLRFLDLSENNINDSFCADILYSSACGPLESLDLSYNTIQKGAKFSEVFAILFGNKILNLFSDVSDSYKPSILKTPSTSIRSNLRHLGIAGCGITNKLFCSLLDCLQQNETLTSIDISSNDIQNTNQSKNALRQLLKNNTGLRMLNLCHNVLTRDTAKEIHLGLLQNFTLLLLPLAGNTGILQSTEMTFIQERLKNNRLRYSKLVTSPNDNTEINPDNHNHNERTSDSKRNESNNASDSPVLVTAVVSPIDTATKSLSNKFTSTVTNAPIVEAFAVDQNLITKKYNELSSNKTIDSINTSITEIVKSPPTKQAHILHVLFSAPLAWRDRNNILHPLDTLDYRAERDALLQVFREVHKDISVNFDFATTDSLRTALSFGCRALHFSGHGHPQCLNFEDGRSGLQLISVDALSNLLRAGGLKLDFVFVSACHSRITGDAFIDAGVPHVVCVKVEALVF